jgi:hypothetical protein
MSTWAISVLPYVILLHLGRVLLHGLRTYLPQEVNVVLGVEPLQLEVSAKLWLVHFHFPI